MGLFLLNPTGHTAHAKPGPLGHRCSLTNDHTMMRIRYELRMKMGGSPGLVVMGGDSHLRGHGFESQYQILDGHYFTLYC